jgi:hypothetical protein
MAILFALVALNNMLDEQKIDSVGFSIETVLHHLNDGESYGRQT